MHTILTQAVDTDAGAVDLRKAVDIVQFDPESLADILPFGLAPAFGADDAFLQFNLILQAAPVDFLRQQQRIGRGGADDRGLQIDHHLQLLFRVAGAHGNRHGAQLFTAGLEADAGSPQAVARGYMDAVLLCDACFLGHDCDKFSLFHYSFLQKLFGICRFYLFNFFP